MGNYQRRVTIFIRLFDFGTVLKQKSNDIRETLDEQSKYDFRAFHMTLTPPAE